MLNSISSIQDKDRIYLSAIFVLSSLLFFKFLFEPSYYLGFSMVEIICHVSGLFICSFLLGAQVSWMCYRVAIAEQQGDSDEP